MNNKPYYSDEESPRTEDLRYEEPIEPPIVKGGQGRSAPSLVLSAWALALMLAIGLWWLFVWLIVLAVTS